MAPSSTPPRLCVLGMGYIGLPTASLLATKGFTVLGVDVNSRVVKTINSGRIHIVEPDLDLLVKSAVHSGNLRAAEKPEAAEIFIIAVPTPFREGHVPDLSYVETAMGSLLPVLKPGDLVILESTSPVGTTDRLAEVARRSRPDLGSGPGVHFAHCPERVLPGRILYELVQNDRVVGGVDAASTVRAAEFYRSFVKGQVLTTDARTAEMTKLVENSHRDLNIAFANELSVLCDAQGIDVWELIRLANHHPRVNILQPGPGVGGHCIAVDPWFLVAADPERTRLIRTARETNDAKPQWVIEKAMAMARARPDALVGCLGLTYKADVDDLRESPALAIARQLRGRLGERCLACDPLIAAIEDPPTVDLDFLLARADILVGLVGHQRFRQIDRGRLAGKVLIDACGIFR